MAEAVADVGHVRSPPSATSRGIPSTPFRAWPIAPHRRNCWRPPPRGRHFIDNFGSHPGDTGLARRGPSDAERCRSPPVDDIIALVDDVVSLGAAAGATSRSRYRATSQVGCRTGHGRHHRVRQVLASGGNAVSFTDTGSVRIVVERAADGPDPLSIVDSGVGIPADEPASVLEPFRVGSTGGDRRGAVSAVDRQTAVEAMEAHSPSGAESPRHVIDVRRPWHRRRLRVVDTAELPSGLRVLVVEEIRSTSSWR